MNVALYYPRERFSINFQYTRIRPFSLIDQIILNLVGDKRSLEEAAKALGLPLRMVVESAFELFRENMLVLTAGNLTMSELGNLWTDTLRDYPRERIHAGKAIIFYDWNLGYCLAEFKLEDPDDDEDGKENDKDMHGLEQRKLFDLKDREEEPVMVQFGVETYGLDEWKNKVWKNLSPNIGDIQEQISIMARSALRNALARENLTLFEMDPLPNLSSCYRHGYKVEGTVQAGSEQLAAEVPEASIPQKDWLLTAESHCRWLSKAMQDARSHLLIFSAHQTNSALESMEKAFRPTNGDSFLVLGYASESEARYKPKADKLRHMIAGRNGSDMKLAVYDGADGNVHLALGSFNWMQSYWEQEDEEPCFNGKPGFEISVVLHSDRHASALEDVLQLISAQVKEYPDSADRSKLLVALDNLRRMLVEKLRSGSSDEDSGSMVVLGRAVTNECGQAMRHAQRRCVVLSHTLSEKMHPLRILSDRQAGFESSCFVAFSEMYPEHGNEGGKRNFATKEQINAYVRKAKSGVSKAVRICRIKGLHSRLIVNDDTVTVTGLNCLSATSAVNNAFGLRFSDPESALMLENLFTKDKSFTQVDSPDSNVGAMLQSLREGEQSMEDLVRAHPELLEALKAIVQQSGKD